MKSADMLKVIGNNNRNSFLRYSVVNNNINNNGKLI